MKSCSEKDIRSNQQTVSLEDGDVRRLKEELIFRTSLSEVLSTYKSPEELFPEVLNVLCMGFKAQGGAIYFKEKYSDHITLKATKGFSPGYSKKYHEIVLGEHLTGKSALRKEAILIKDSYDDPRSTDGVVKVLKYRSALVTPVMSRDDVVGVIALIHSEPNSFDERDLNLINSIGGNLSLAIINSYLHRDVLEEKAKVLSIIEGSREGIFEALVSPPDRDGVEDDPEAFGRLARFTLLNSIFREQVNGRVEEGSPMAEGFRSDFLDSSLSKVIKKGYYQGIERIDDNGTKGIYELDLFAIQDDRGVFGIRGIRRDITSRMRMQRRLQESKRRMGLYLDLLSHDISNINTVSLGFLQLLMDKNEWDEVSRKFIDESMTALKRSSQLVSKVKLLAQTQSEPVSLSLVNIQPFIRDSVKSLRDIYPGKDLEVQIMKEGSSMELRCDDLIGDLIFNIIENSLLHDNSERVKIDIQYESFSLEGLDGVLLSFSDRGPGIPNEMKKRIFRRKERKEDVRPGRGLGLVIINSIVERYGGRIWIEDRILGDPTSGVKFSIFLPRG